MEIQFEKVEVEREWIKTKGEKVSTEENRVAAEVKQVELARFTEKSRPMFTNSGLMDKDQKKRNGSIRCVATSMSTVKLVVVIAGEPVPTLRRKGRMSHGGSNHE